MNAHNKTLSQGGGQGSHARIPTHAGRAPGELEKLEVDQEMMIEDLSRRVAAQSHPPSSSNNGGTLINQEGEGGGEGISMGTFEKTTFSQILAQYNQKHDLPPTVELTQAFLMASNLKEAAARVSGLTGAGGQASFLKNEIVGDQMRMMDSMQSVSRLLGNIGSSDLASNFLLEQRNLMRAQATENKVIRELIEEKIIDGIEYIRMKEQLAETKSRVKHLLDETFTSDEDQAGAKKVLVHSKPDNKDMRISSSGGSSSSNSNSANNHHQQTNMLTQEDSDTVKRNRALAEKRILNIIKTLRSDAREYLAKRRGGQDFIEGAANVETMSLTKIWKGLSKSKEYRRRREHKALDKGKKTMADTLQQSAEQLRAELAKIEGEMKQAGCQEKTKREIERAVAQYEQIIGLEKRVCQDSFDKSMAEIDAMPLNLNSYQIQNALFNICGIDLREESLLRQKPLRKDLLGNIKKVPLKSSILQSYYEHAPAEQPMKKNEQSGKKKNHELVKVIGLEPEKLFTTLDKYKVQISKMPKFSNVFERAEPIMPNVSMTVPGQVICESQEGGQMTYARIDGRSVISLQFNPYYDTKDDPSKKKELDQALKEIQDQREKTNVPLSSKASIAAKANKEKLETANIRKAWLNIVKKDLPKAYRQYQKFKTDQENNNKKQCQNCLKEVRKKALKTQRLQKESQLRAKKLNKDMMTFWKKRDKEITDLKRKREKYEKELRRRIEEEREAVLQKKRLEFIMQQSEIYAHFMSKKLGLSEEQQKQKQMDMEDEQTGQFKRYDIDEKEARNNIASMINDNRSRVNDFDTETQQRKGHGLLSKVKEDELEVDRFDNPDEGLSSVLNPPKCFLGHLKAYQLKGLRWLDNLYEQGINGILADEMGLGKTIQAISLLAHLVETKGVWGPFLIIVPCTVLSNWQNELNKFCPSLKVLPFFGSPEERKKLGKFLDPKNLYNPNMRINILLTSYNLIVNQSKDQMKLLRIKWHYMILDEAQAIKNNLSRRWKVLLQFNTRNRLLLTGTPIQNSMAELWALLHFIMPKLFDSHEQFQEWFSKDIEANSLTDQGEINKHQLRRLHLVLKPFMLRRLKDDIELEIGPKTEFTHTCMMTHRQKVLYQRIKNKISTKDLFKLVESKAKMENLMNLVMQFRKVCNHPELFERRVGRIPMTFKELQVGMQPNPLLSQIPDLRTQMKNPISYELPRIIYDECLLISDNNTKMFKKIGRYDEAFSELGVENHMRFFNIFNTLNLYQESFEPKSGFSILRLLCKSNKWSFGELSWMHVADPLIKQIALMHYHFEKFHRKYYMTVLRTESKQVEISRLRLPTDKSLDINFIDFYNRDPSVSMLYRDNLVYDSSGKANFLPPLITDDFNSFTKFSNVLKSDLDMYVSACQAEPVQITCRNGTFKRLFTSLTNSSMHKKALVGHNFKPRSEIHLGRIGRDRTSFLDLDSLSSIKYGPPTGYNLIENGIIGDAITEKGASILELPNYSRLVTDCAKMKFLDRLLADLNKGGHRVLIFCQMTKMLDILEDFLCWRKYTYFRMDGSTNLQDRRFMVEDFQKNPNVFAFLLSTRAGGLGVNLTAADTVIFYDNDWNPTIDAQAQDRAHRIGQTKPVSVYRLITKGTVEEKIVKRAKQKQTVQSTVYGGNALKADVFKAKEVVDMLLDEQEEEDLKHRQQAFLRTRRVKRSTTNKAAEDYGGGSSSAAAAMKDETMIDTSSSALKKREQITSPVKQKAMMPEIFKSSRVVVGVEQQQQQKVMNIFTTVKTAGGKGSEQAQMKSQMMIAEEDMEDEMMEDEEDEEIMARKKLLKLLEKGDNYDDDDDDGVAIEYNSGEDGAGNNEAEKNGKGGLANGKAGKAEENGELDDEDIMGDDY